MRGCHSALLIMDRSHALLGLLPRVYRLRGRRVGCCNKGCRFCGRRGALVRRTLRRHVRRGRGTLHVTHGITHRATRHESGRGMHNRGDGVGGKIPHVMLGTLRKGSRGDADGLANIRRRGTRGLASRHGRLQNSLSPATTLGASFGDSSLRAKGVLIATGRVGFDCRSGSVGGGVLAGSRVGLSSANCRPGPGDGSVRRGDVSGRRL